MSCNKEKNGHKITEIQPIEITVYSLQWYFLESKIAILNLRPDGLFRVARVWPEDPDNSYNVYPPPQTILLVLIDNLNQL